MGRMQPMTEKYWTYEHDDVVRDHELKTKKEAEQAADVWWDESCSDQDGLCNGDTYEDDVTFIEFHYDDDGEMVVDNRIKGTLYFEYYHGDFAEHNVWHSGGGGVL